MTREEIRAAIGPVLTCSSSRTAVEYFDWKPTHDIAMRSVFTGLADRFAERTR